MNTNNFIALANLYHNNKYNYIKFIYVNSKTRSIITCQLHGDFTQTPYRHLRSIGCPRCLPNNNTKLTVDQFISKSQSIHNNKYNYNKTVYINGRTNIIITCPTHGDFQQTPENHLSGKGCKLCGHNSMNIKLKSSCSGVIKQFKKVHGNYYDYSQFIYKNRRTKSTIICPKHGLFQQNADKHLRGDGCRKCGMSLGERRIAEWLNTNNIKYIIECKFDGLIGQKQYPLRFDFYLPDHNMCIEFDGVQHSKYCPGLLGISNKHNTIERYKTLLENDNIKNKYCINHNIKLLRITYSHIGNISKILASNLQE